MKLTTVLRIDDWRVRVAHLAAEAVTWLGFATSVLLALAFVAATAGAGVEKALLALAIVGAFLACAAFAMVVAACGIRPLLLRLARRAVDDERAGDCRPEV